MNSFEMFKRRVASRIESSQVTIDRFRNQINNDEPAQIGRASCRERV